MVSQVGPEGSDADVSARRKRERVYRILHCWCGHSATHELVVTGRLGSVWTGLVCAYHRDLWNWPEDRVECLCDACSLSRAQSAQPIAQRPLTGVPGQPG